MSIHVKQAGEWQEVPDDERVFVKVAGVWEMIGNPRPTYNDATGGTVTEVRANGKLYRVHTFSASADFTVLAGVAPFYFSLLGAGGAGSHGWSGVTYGGGGAGGGYVVDQVVSSLAKGPHPVVVGVGGRGDNGNHAAGANGGDTSFAGVTVGGGQGGRDDGSSGASGAPQSFPGHARSGITGAGAPGAAGSGSGANGGPGVDWYGTPAAGGGSGCSDGVSGTTTHGGGRGAMMNNVPGDGGLGAGGGGTRAENPNRSGNGGDGSARIWYEIEAPPAIYNDATGGTRTEYTTPEGLRIARHTFLTSGTFTVTQAVQPFYAYLIGGGGQGGAASYFTGGTGGTGGYLQIQRDLAVGDFPVVVGGGGSGAPNGGNAGGSTSFDGVWAGGGAGGHQNPQTNGNYPAGVPGNPSPDGDGEGSQRPTDLSGPPQAALGLSGRGRGGGGGPANSSQPGSAGSAGAAVIEYVIAPPPPPVFNDATGGTAVEVANYNGSGETWRVHTLTNGQVLEVIGAPQPFRILAVAGGAAGFTNNVNASGGGGGGEVIDTTRTLAPGSYPATVGDMGRWNGSTGNNAGPSSIADVTARAGTNAPISGGGGTSGNGYGPGGGLISGGGGSGGAASGATGGPGVASNITGASVTYGVGGSNTTSPWTPGSGGTALSNNGTLGTVIVAYRIG